MSNGMFKYDLSSEQLRAVQKEFERRRKRPWVAWGLWLSTGILGTHRFYLGDKGGGLLLLCSAGGLGVLWLLDAFTLRERIRRSCQAVEAEIILTMLNKGAQQHSSRAPLKPSSWEGVIN